MPVLVGCLVNVADWQTDFNGSFLAAIFSMTDKVVRPMLDKLK
jgi:hypothetical protein